MAIINNPRIEPLPIRVGVGRRLTVIALGISLAGFGAAAPWWMPDRCRWVGWLTAALFVPVGSIGAYLGARGRAADLEAFSARNIARGFWDELICGLVSHWP